MDIRNHMHKARLGLQFSKLDQVNLKEKIKYWQQQGREDKMFFRPYLSPKENDCSESSVSKSLLWVHQMPWQQQLMTKYGNHISLIDATYKTTRYELPLFFVCIRTNVGYCVVADFIVQSECIPSIKEALEILREWNPE